MQDLLLKKIDEHINVFEEIKNSKEIIESVSSAAKSICESFNKGGALYLCGNGGSAADAQHIATEFVSRFYIERKAINAEALTVNTSSLTAISNDYGYENVFVRQIEAKGNPGDVLLAISTSGRSANVVKACEFAANNGIHTILMTGNRENEYNPDVFEYVIRIPSDDTPRIQEGHIFVGHLLAEYVESIMIKG